MIREAQLSDAPAVASLYAHHVLTGTGTFDITPPDAEAVAHRMRAVLAQGWPWLVAEADGALLGYACAARFRDREAYARTCESSVYVAPSAQGRGIGSRLMDALISAARASGFRQMVAVVGDSANAASLALHRRLGFREVGCLRAVGEKFGRRLDVVLMQRPLAD